MRALSGKTVSRGVTGGVSARMTPGVARAGLVTQPGSSRAHPSHGCKEQPSPRCPGGCPHYQRSHSTSPGAGSARLEDKSPGVISPRGFWQLQHMVPCREASLSAFPSSGLCLLLDQIQSMNPVSPSPQRQARRAGWRFPEEHQELAATIAQHLP